MAGVAEAWAERNFITINDGTVTRENTGDSDPLPTDTALIGGMAEADTGAATAKSNTVIVNGGKITGNIYGGYAVSQTGASKATDNIVTVSGSADLSAASLYGGGSLAQYADVNSANDFFTGNTLNKNSSTAVHDAHNFEFVTFGYSGDTNIDTLDLSGGNVLLDTGDHTVNYNGVFSGSGALTKIGTGVLNFGKNMALGGKIAVQNGGFAISQSLSLTTNGGLLFGADSEFIPNGNTLTVIGGVTIDEGAFINLTDIDEGKMVLTSGDGIGGFFDSMFYETEFRDNNKELWVVGEFSDDEKTGNIIADLADSGVTTGKNGAKGIGQLVSILDSASLEVEKELMKSLEAIVILADSGDRGGASIALQQILGQHSTRATQAARSIAQSFGGAIAGHLTQMRDSRMAANSAPGVRSRSAYAAMRAPRNVRYARGGYGQSDAANRIWAGGFGSFASQDDDDGEYGYDYDSGGFILGYDHYFGDSLTVGFSGAYSHGAIEGNDGYSETDVDTMNLGVYASYDAPNGFYADANLGFGFTWNEEDERLVLGGRRSGEFETFSFQMGGNAGYAFRLPAEFRIVPTVGLQYIHVDQDEYEQSGNVLAMWRDSSTADYLEVPLAVRVDRTFDLGGGVSVTPEARAAWIIEAKRDETSVRTGFVGSNASMIVSGTNPGRHRGLVGAGLKIRLDGRFDASLNYNLEFRRNYTNHNIMAGVGVSF